MLNKQEQKEKNDKDYLLNELSLILSSSDTKTIIKIKLYNDYYTTKTLNINRKLIRNIYKLIERGC